MKTFSLVGATYTKVDLSAAQQARLSTAIQGSLMARSLMESVLPLKFMLEFVCFDLEHMLQLDDRSDLFPGCKTYVVCVSRMIEGPPIPIHQARTINVYPDGRILTTTVTFSGTTGEVKALTDDISLTDEQVVEGSTDTEGFKLPFGDN